MKYVTNKGLLCSVADCSAPAYCKTLCASHYKKLRKYGDPLYVKSAPTHKVCRACNLEQPVENFYTTQYAPGKTTRRSVCASCYVPIHGGPARERRFGLYPGQYEEMFADQDGRCAICGQPETRKVKGKLISLAVDHDHETGQVRGLLCNMHNRMLGFAGDDVEILRVAVRYLESQS